MNGLDLEMLGKLLGLCGSSYDGEAVAAARKADELVRAAGATWQEVLEPCRPLQLAIAAAQQLLAENEALRRNATAVPGHREDWNIVGSPPQQARWALDLYADQQLHLSSFEEQFLSGIANGSATLAHTQEAVFFRLFGAIVKRSRRVPP